MRIVRHDPLEPGSIQPLELVRLNRIPNTLYFGSRKGDQIGITGSETDPPAISNHLNNIAREQGAFATGFLLPVQDRASREMPSQPEQGHAVREGISLPRPESDALAGTHDPFPVCLVEIDGDVKAIGPFHHRDVCVTRLLHRGQRAGMVHQSGAAGFCELVVALYLSCIASAQARLNRGNSSNGISWRM